MRQHGREGGHPLCDAAQARGSVVDGVHAGHHRWQHLRCADVGGGFLTPYVLFARLQGQPVGRVALGIDAHTHQPARHRTLEFVPAGQVGCVRTTVAQRHAKALAVAHRDVGAKLSWRHQQCQCQQVSRHDHHAAARLVGGDPGPVIAHHAAQARVLQQHAEAVFGQPLRAAAGLDGDAERPGPGLQHGQCLRQHLVVHQEGGGFGLAHAHGQCHGLGGCGGLVEHRGVGDRHTGQVGHHGLEVQQRLQPALADFGLVGGVRRVPGRVFQDVAQDHARRVGAVIALTDEVAKHLVAAGDAAQFRQSGGFGQGRRDGHGAASGNAGGHDARHQAATRLGANGLQHQGLIGRGDADVARGELMTVLQLTQGFGRLHQHGGLLGAGGLGGGKAGVSGFVHQFMELLRLADPDLEKPAGSERI